MSSVATLAYLAGMIDADGYITINRSERSAGIYHAPQVGIAGTRREPHDLAASIWGGRVGMFKPKNLAHRPQFQWTRQGASAVIVIQAIRPYLRVKAKNAALALDLWEHTEEGRATKDGPYPWFAADYDPIQARDVMRQEMIDLNQSRNRVGKKRAGRQLDGRSWDEYPEKRA